MPWLWGAALSACLAIPGTTTPYDLDPVPHAVASGGMILTVGLGEVAVKPSLKGGFNCVLSRDGDRCDPAHLWGFDQGVVGGQSLAWRRVSDVGALTALIVPMGASLLDSYLSQSATPWTDAAVDTLVELESAIAATFITAAFKYGVRRPRPGMYSPGEQTVEGQMSFPSGHTSATSAALMAYSMTFALRHPDNPWRFAVMGGSTLLTGITAYGRVAGGMHFYTDVAAGAILGCSVGFLLPYLLRKNPAVQLGVAGGDLPGARQLQLIWRY